MEQLDETVLQLKKEQKKAQYSTLESGMYICDEIVNFEPKVLFDGLISVMLPVTFIKMPKQIAKMKYMSESRPQLIFTNRDGSVNINFSYLETPLQADQLSHLKEQMRQILKHLNPSIVFYESAVLTENKPPLAWFEHKSPALDGDIFNLTSAVIIGENLLHMTFNCPMKAATEWRSAARQMLLSIVDLKKKNREL